MNTTIAPGERAPQREEFVVESLPVRVCEDARMVAEEASTLAARHLQGTLARQGSAAVMLATGVSQLVLLERLIATPGIDWATPHA